MSKEINPKQMNRRDFLRIAGLFGVGALVSARLPELWLPPSAEADRGVLGGRGRDGSRGGGRVPERLPGANDENLGFEKPDPRSLLEPLGWNGINSDLTSYILNDGSGSQRSVAVRGQFTNWVPRYGAWQQEGLTSLDRNSAIPVELDAKWFEGFPPYVAVRIKYFNSARQEIASKRPSVLMQGAMGQWRHYILGTIGPGEHPAGAAFTRRVLEIDAEPLNLDPNGRTTEVRFDNVT